MARLRCTRSFSRTHAAAAAAAAALRTPLRCALLKSPLFQHRREEARNARASRRRLAARGGMGGGVMKMNNA